MDVLVVDIGGSRVKLKVSNQTEVRRFESGPDLTPETTVARVKELTADWHCDAISIGYPGSVSAGGPSAEPGNLGCGWVGFDFAGALGKPVRVVNDAVLQALGAYDGGRMLFLGLGTGVGSALVTEHVVVPLELGCLSWKDETVWDRLGRRALDDRGIMEWSRDVAGVTAMLRQACAADYVLLGGGNARKVDPFPKGARLGGNEHAFLGGCRLWEEMVEPHGRPSPPVWRVVR
jgi:polyphosphate glucokinase